MRQLKTVLLSILLLAGSAPLASADFEQCAAGGVVTACAGETVRDTGSGSACSNEGDAYHAMTYVTVWGPNGVELRAWGRESCDTSPYGTTNEDLLAIVLYSPAGNAGAAWYTYTAPWADVCTVYVASSLGGVPVFQDLGCPAGASPEPGWGTFLP